MTAAMVVDVLAAGGRAQAAVAPLAYLAAQLAALVLLYLRPRPRTALIYLAAGTVCTVGFQWALFTADPGIADDSQFLVNRTIVAMIAVGAVTGRPIAGIQWSTAALLAGEFASAALQAGLGRQIELGAGPLIAYLLVVILMLWMMRSSRSQQAHVPDSRSVDAETRRLEEERDAEARAAAVIHDTVLGDLAAIVHGRVVLTEHDQEHLRQNVARLQAAMSGDIDATATAAVDVELLQVISDLQWRGLSVEASGNGAALSLLGRPARTAALNAIRAALENVLVHAGAASADLFIDDNDDEVMIMVVDQGKGYDPDAVGSDRLGLRLSIVKRIEDCGGRATVWSRPGEGTSIVLSLPKAGGDGRGPVAAV